MINKILDKSNNLEIMARNSRYLAINVFDKETLTKKVVNLL